MTIGNPPPIGGTGYVSSPEHDRYILIMFRHPFCGGEVGGGRGASRGLGGVWRQRGGNRRRCGGDDERWRWRRVWWLPGHHGGVSLAAEESVEACLASPVVFAVSDLRCHDMK